MQLSLLYIYPDMKSFFFNNVKLVGITQTQTHTHTHTLTHIRLHHHSIELS